MRNENAYPRQRGTAGNQGGAYVSTVEEFSQAYERAHEAVRALLRGDPEPQKHMFSRHDDAILMNPARVTVRGREQIAQTLDQVASTMSDGDVDFENLVTYATPELAFIAELEQSQGRFSGGAGIVPFTLRVPTILRPEDGRWRIIHRHADPIAAPQPLESMVGR